MKNVRIVIGILNYNMRAHQTDKSEDTYYNNLADKYARDMALSQMK